jgi:hypothetical protein
MARTKHEERNVSAVKLDDSEVVRRKVDGCGDVYNPEEVVV